MLDLNATEAVVDPKEAAETVGLSYVSDTSPGIKRLKTGKHFRYVGRGGKVADAASLARIKALAIPPAWTDVWICSRANGHIQATGRDARGANSTVITRFREVRESTKYQHMMAFAKSLPLIRKKVSEHLAMRGYPARRFWRPWFTFWKPRLSESAATSTRAATRATV